LAEKKGTLRGQEKEKNRLVCFSWKRGGGSRSLFRSQWAKETKVILEEEKGRVLPFSPLEGGKGGEILRRTHPQSLLGGKKVIKRP